MRKHLRAKGEAMEMRDTEKRGGKRKLKWVGYGEEGSRRPAGEDHRQAAMAGRQCDHNRPSHHPTVGPGGIKQQPNSSSGAAAARPLLEAARLPLPLVVVCTQRPALRLPSFLPQHSCNVHLIALYFSARPTPGPHLPGMDWHEAASGTA